MEDQQQQEVGMSSNYRYYGVCVVLALLVHVLLAKLGKKRGRRLPPGPWQLPVIGSIHHLLSKFPHHTMRDLSARHGPVMLLRVCERKIVVVSSAEAAREVFMGHHTAFEQRPTSPGLDELHAGYGMGVALAPYGEHWRMLRRILMTELLSPRRVEAFRSIREDEAARLASSLASNPPGKPVNVSALLAGFVADSSMRSIFGDRLPDRAAFLEMMKHATELSSVFDLRDLFPTSTLVKMLPRSRKAERHLQEVFRLFDGVLRHHEGRKSGPGGDAGVQNMIDVLLRIQKEGDMRVSLTPGVIKSMIMDVYGAALDTQSIALQWAMAELMINPRVMEKLQQEIRRVLAGHKRVQEADLSNLPYLKAVIKEALRLHPPTSLIFRLCLEEDQQVQGYDVPRGTIVVTNGWAISRDPKYWKNPEKFIPERFEEGEGAPDFKGSDFEYLPFGAGRRICPGITFAQVTMEIVLATLLYHFDWELPSGVEDIDMTEAFGITIKRKTDLLLHPITRIPHSHE